MKAKRTRNRTPQAQWSFSGLNLDGWRATPELLAWAQRSAEFRSILTVLVNERERLVLPIPGTSENMQLGVNVGVDRAIALLRDMAKGGELARPSEPEPTYTPEALLSDVAND